MKIIQYYNYKEIRDGLMNGSDFITKDENHSNFIFTYNNGIKYRIQFFKIPGRGYWIYNVWALHPEKKEWVFKQSSKYNIWELLNISYRKADIEDRKIFFMNSKEFKRKPRELWNVKMDRQV